MADLGHSLAPNLDIGQIEGAVVQAGPPLQCCQASTARLDTGRLQGVGMTCTEELVWGDKAHSWLKPGVLHTCGPGEHCIPWPSWERQLMRA